MQELSELCVNVADHNGLLALDEQAICDLVYRQPVLSWIVSPDADTFWFNDTWYRYSGLMPGDMAHWAWQDFVPFSEVGRVAESFYEALREGEEWEQIFPIRGRDGQYRLFMAHGAPMAESSDKIRYWVCCAIDITHVCSREIMLAKGRISAGR